jgi:hypothetical protein
VHIYIEELSKGYEELLHASVQIGLSKNPSIQEVQEEPLLLEHVKQGNLHVEHKFVVKSAYVVLIEQVFTQLLPYK